MTQDGFVSVNELYAVLKSLRNGKLAQERMAMICSDIQMRCPVETVSDFYTELHIGDAKEKYSCFRTAIKGLECLWRTK